MKLSEHQAQIMVRAVRDYIAPEVYYDEMLPQERPPYVEIPVTNEVRLRIVDACMDAFKQADYHTIGDLNLAYSLSADDCRKLIKAAVKFLNAKARSSFADDMRDAGIDIPKTDGGY